MCTTGAFLQRHTMRVPCTSGVLFATTDEYITPIDKNPFTTMAQRTVCTEAGSYGPTSHRDLP